MTDLELGVLAEDQNDCDVIDVLCRRILLGGGIGPNAWRLRRRAGKGCAKLRRKAAGWLAELAQQGCRAAIIVHDLDRNPLNGSLNELAVLERELNVIPVPHGLIRHICIPVEEIEAWFFSSERVLERVCGKPTERILHRTASRGQKRSSSICHAAPTGSRGTLRTTTPSSRRIWTWRSAPSGAPRSRC
jgi:hypothetical protein